MVSKQIPDVYHVRMDAGATIRCVRNGARLTLRALAAAAHTSHSTLAAYESGRVVPTVETAERVIEAAGFRLEAGLVRNLADRSTRGDELLQVLELAAMFPARHASTLPYPRFGPQ